MRILKSSDPWSIIICRYLCLVLSRHFFQGFPHELLLETGVFLVSLKLILMAKKTTETERRLEQRLIEIQATLARPNSSPRY